MALRQLFSKALVPGLEKDMARVVKKEIDTFTPMLNAMLSPQCYGFVNQGASAGAYRATSASANRVVKMDFPITQKGMFQ